MTELRECPFCGGRANVVSSSTIYFKMQCANCGAALDYYGNESEAIEKWNNRTNNEESIFKAALFSKNSSAIPNFRIFNDKPITSLNLSEMEHYCEEHNITADKIIGISSFLHTFYDGTQNGILDFLLIYES